MSHGYFRSPNGQITGFDAPGAGTGNGQGTFEAAVCGLNAFGVITGSNDDNGGGLHGYVRDPRGHIIASDGPGGGIGFMRGTNGINAGGIIDFSDEMGPAKPAAIRILMGLVRPTDGSV